ncbi:MAG TPA: DUF4175 family protein, partial [Gemmataceae bacterium]
MATVQEPKAGRYEAFVAAELARARRRIRAQDVGAAALGLLAGTLAYALGMVLLDRWFDLPDAAREVSLFAFLAAAAAYVGIVLTRPFRREVNPYFAARRVERAVPGAKNSVVSWLDLHEAPLPASIRAAVSQKAAADLKRADVDEVVRDARLPWLGGVAGGLFVAALILFFLIRPNQFLSLLGRAFAPFGSGAIARQTTLELAQPAGGDVTVPVNTPVDFRVEVLGRVPDPAAADAVRLRFRYNPADPVAEEIRLDPSARDPREFAVRVPAGRVQTGFVYQIVGGDAATPEYRVTVRSSPLIEGWNLAYHFRPYLHFPDKTTANANIEELRGTAVTLTAKTNRTVRDGTLTFHPVRADQVVPPPLVAERVPDQPAALRFRFVLTEDARYTIKFHSAEGESNGEPIPYTIKVLIDQPPRVEVTHPAPDTLPVNGTIDVEGKASDDYGIVAMRLCLQLPDAEKPTALAPKPYRPGKVFKFADDTYPRALDYKDFLPLDQLKTTIGAAVPLKPGTVIEYWLEAEDNCDNPKANVGRSKVYRVTLAEKQEEDNKQAADQRAAQDKAEHDKKQDQDLDRENEAKKQQQQPGDQGEQGDKQPGEPPMNPDGQPQQADGNQQGDPKDRDIEKQAREIQDKLNRAKQGEKGQAKPDPAQQPGEPKDNKGENKDGNPQAGDQQQPKPGQDHKQDGKPQGGNQQQPNPGQGGNPQGGANQPQSDNKGEGKGDPQAGQPQQGGAKGEAKPDGQPNPQPGQPDANPMQPGGQGGAQNQPKDGQQPANPIPNNQPGNAPNPNNRDAKNPDGGPPNGAQQQPNAQQKPDGKGANQPSPNGAGNAGQQQPNAGQPDNKQSQPKGGQGANSGQPQAQRNAGDAKPQPHPGQPNADAKGGQPPGDAKPGEPKGGDPNAAGQKAGDDHGKPGETPNAGNPPNGNPKDNRAGQPKAGPPTQPQNPTGDTKPTNDNRTPSDNPQKSPDGNNSPPKPEQGSGGQAGNKDQSAERSGSGPKKDPNNREPKGQPDAKDQGRDGQGSKTGSGQPGGTPPQGAKPQDAPAGQGQGGKPEKGEAKPDNQPAGDNPKGEAKPDGGQPDDSTPGQPGGEKGPTGQGHLQDAPRGGHGDKPGAGTTTQPMTDGTPSGGPPSGNQSKEPAGNNPKDGAGQDAAGQPKPDKNQPGTGQQSGQGELGKLAQDLKSNDPATRKAAEERLKELQKQLANDPAARKALEEATKKGDGSGNAGGSKKPGGQRADQNPQDKQGPAAGDKPDPNAAKPSGTGEQGTKPGEGHGEPKAQQPKPGEGSNPGEGNPGPAPGKPTDKPGGKAAGHPGTGTPQPDETGPPNNQPGDGQTPTQPGRNAARRDGTGTPSDNPGTTDDTPRPSTAEKGTAPNAENA